VVATDEEIAAVASIALLHSSRSPTDHPWAGLPLRDLIERTDYRRIRAGLSESALQRWLAPRWRIQNQWLDWCDDKRTSSGFYVGQERRAPNRWVIGSIGSEEQTVHRTKSEAIAAYILRELDYWSTRPNART
jgi:hypothetical protein